MKPKFKVGQVVRYGDVLAEIEFIIPVFNKNIIIGYEYDINRLDSAKEKDLRALTAREVGR